MAIQAQPAGTIPASDRYLDLVRAFPLRPIRSDEDHKRAIDAVDALADRRDGWGPDESDYFVVLALLIERYEDEIYGDSSGARAESTSVR